jgi:hypothetical protein
MGSKSRSNAPAPVDANATARAQSAANRETAISQANLNMVNQYTPSGSLEYTQRGTASDGTPQYSATQTLTPEQQRIYDYQTQASTTYGRMGNNLLNSVETQFSQPIDYSSLGAAPTYDATFRDQQRQNYITRSQPQWDQRRSSLETQLANQGIGYGSQAYNDAMRSYDQGFNDFLLTADMNAGNMADAEYGRQQRARTNQMNEMYLPRQQTYNELAALNSGTSLQTPSYINTPQTGIQNTDVIGANALQYQGQQNAYNQQMQQQNANMGGLYGLGGSLGGGYLASGGRFW